MYNRCDVAPFFGAVIMKCRLCDNVLMLIMLGSIRGYLFCNLCDGWAGMLCNVSMLISRFTSVSVTILEM